MFDVCITGSEFFQFDTAAGPGFFDEIFRNVNTLSEVITWDFPFMNDMQVLVIYTLELTQIEGYC